ncbi:uncharacterized protein LOC133238508 isoform X1 [Bos javanicus]|uniref:uncharacterized protein LOC133238508 isoform X1 n=1 Tax=Bos javanicus TaxID=9906 RepID=UPI002AA78335|nr:uncharacterized protein LOC133238508 isoform X1 [Bos javanicus]
MATSRRPGLGRKEGPSALGGRWTRALSVPRPALSDYPRRRWWPTSRELPRRASWLPDTYEELTPSGMMDTWDPKTAGLEGPSRKELPTCALCQALKVGIFVNIVITLCFESLPLKDEVLATRGGRHYRFLDLSDVFSPSPSLIPTGDRNSSPPLASEGTRLHFPGGRQKRVARREGNRLSVSVGSQFGLLAVMHISTAHVFSLLSKGRDYVAQQALARRMC